MKKKIFLGFLKKSPRFSEKKKKFERKKSQNSEIKGRTLTFFSELYFFPSVPLILFR